MAAYIELCITLEPTDARLGCRRLLARKQSQGSGLGEGKNSRADCLSQLPSCFPHELSPGSKVGMSALEWEGGGWVWENEAHPSGHLQPLWASSGGTGFRTKLQCPTALPAEPGISTQIVLSAQCWCGPNCGWVLGELHISPVQATPT